MARTCIIVADATRARFLTLEVPIEPASEGGPRLVEHIDLVNPELDDPERGLFSDRSGSGHASPMGAAHALDDHRDDHLREIERRYARRISEQLESFVIERGAVVVLLVADPRLLGTLREQIDEGHLGFVEIVEVGENLARRPLGQIQSILALRGLVPAPQAPRMGVFHPRGQAPAGH
jgi:protein required for attachment to host cells